MENQTENPYKAPEAALDISEGKRLSEVFQRFSAWSVLGLSIVTLGVYSIFWLYNRSKSINSVSENPIGSTFIVISMVLLVVSCFDTVSGFILPGAPTLLLILSVISFIGTVMSIVWVFKIRNRIHLYTGSEKGDSAWAGPIMTFFFNILYLQYKINQAIDEEGAL